MRVPRVLGLGDAERGELLGERPALLPIALGELGEEALALRPPGALVLERAQRIGGVGLAGQQSCERLARRRELEVALAQQRLDLGETGVGRGQSAAGLGDLLRAQRELVEEVALAEAALFRLDLLAMNPVAQRRELAQRGEELLARRLEARFGGRRDRLDLAQPGAVRLDERRRLIVLDDQPGAARR